MSYLQATSSLAMVAPLFDQHMDTFLSTFVSGFQPILFGATEQLDTHVTDRVMEKLQQKLHLSSSQETLIDEREVHSEFWPDIVGKGWSTAIHQRLRQLNQHVVTKILEQVPTVFQQHIQSVVLDRFMNVKNGNGATSMNEERGFGISNFMTSFVQEHASSKLDGVTDQIWKQVQAPFTEGLVTLFTHFESGIMDSVKNEVAKVPGLNF
ncbi:hypothetical protein HMI55_001635 [Coelomomyces lativittatus]|nr:hypothetical protein HMI55_001635 [Coelomomyces lativittatus]